MQKVAAAAKKKADEGIVIEEQVGGMPTIDPNEKDFDKMTTRELRNVRGRTPLHACLQRTVC